MPAAQAAPAGAMAPEQEMRSSAIVKTARKAQAAKLALNGAMDAAGQSMKSAFRTHISPTFKSLEPRHMSTGPKALWKHIYCKGSQQQAPMLTPKAQSDLVTQTSPDGFDSFELVRAISDNPSPRKRRLSVSKCSDEEDDVLCLSPTETSISTTASTGDLQAFRQDLSTEGGSFVSDQSGDDASEGPLFWENEEACAEDEGMHERWESALLGRQISELSLEEVRNLVRHGMPVKYRHQVWPRLFSVKEVVEVVNDDELEQCVPSNVAHQIDLDVPRTRSRWLGEAERIMLRRVLRAYAMRDPVVGYCQGMGDIAASFILLGLDEPEVLRGLCSMVQGCCPNYFCPNLKGYIRDMAVLEVLVRELLPSETVQRLDCVGVPLRMLAADHFLTLASHTWPLGAVVQLWDLFLLEGPPAIFASFITLLELYLPKEQGGVGGPEQVEAFVNAVSGGAVADLGMILERTWELIPSIPISRIESLRYVFSAPA